MLWLIWIITILAVIATKVYTTKTVIRTRFKLDELQKRVSRVKMEEKVARSCVEVANRELSEVQKTIAAQINAVENLKGVLETLEQERLKKLEETKNRLSH